MILEQLREEVYQTYIKMRNDNVIRGHQGNVSARDAKTNYIAITPSGISCDEMKIDDIAVINNQGDLIDGDCKPSIEMPMHTHILNNNPNIAAVIHSHAPYATVFAITHEEIPVVTIESAVLMGSNVRVAPFQEPGTKELGQSALETLGSDAAVLLANHGLLTVGRNLNSAYKATIACEETARLVIMAYSINKTPIQLSDCFVSSFRKKLMDWQLVEEKKN
jgi:L-ribulose-5-phosphate 4-epimerase